MKVNKIFYSCVAIGIMFGMAIMGLMQGISGRMDIMEAISVFCILGTASAFAATSMVKKLNIVWNYLVPLVFQKNKPAECFICNKGTCLECEILEDWRMLLRKR